MHMKRFVVYAIALAGAITGVLHWAANGRQIAVVDAPSDRLPCVSYSPFHRPGQSPLLKTSVIGRSQIDADLAQQALEIAIGVARTGAAREMGAGDQGLMYGAADAKADGRACKHAGDVRKRNSGAAFPFRVVPRDGKCCPDDRL